MASRPDLSGRSTSTCRSKRPGRNSAESKLSGRLVAARTITVAPPAAKPSISVSSWLSVCSRSSLPPYKLLLRDLPIASNSSIKIMQGACFLACSNRSRTRAAPAPTNNSTNSDPEMLKNDTPASPATALASSVLPVPGGPTNNTPLGIRAPIWVKRSGLFKNSTISTNSVLASSTPATSLKVVLADSPST